MKKLRISEVLDDLKSFDNKEVELKGWVHKVRNQSNVLLFGIKRYIRINTMFCR
jgi:aspartyl/asparaginyl-tRNA synthetase